ncbi:hypothetical protein MalM25_32980 [Planctomycetes bacterium MalM25]|nr:hypothetical protein MalM25_32980 [Planctomycetes bacterium MalM25]
MDEAASSTLEDLRDSIEWLQTAVGKITEAADFARVLGDSGVSGFEATLQDVRKSRDVVVSNLEKLVGPGWRDELELASPEALLTSCRRFKEARDSERVEALARETLSALAGELGRHRAEAHRSFKPRVEQILKEAIRECEELGNSTKAQQLPLLRPDGVARLMIKWRTSDDVMRDQESAAWKAALPALSQLIEVADLLCPIQDEACDPDEDQTPPAKPVPDPPETPETRTEVDEREDRDVAIPVKEATKLDGAAGGLGGGLGSKPLAPASATLCEPAGTSDPRGEPLADELPKEAQDPVSTLDDEQEPPQSAGQQTAAEPGTKSEVLQRAEAAAWQALVDEKPSLAYQILSTLDEVSTDVHRTPRDLADLVLLEPSFVRSPQAFAEPRREASTRFASWLTGLSDDGIATAHRMVALAASLVPALVSVRSEASEALAPIAGLEAVWPEFEKVRAAVESFTNSRVEVAPSVFRGVKDHADWDQGCEDRRRELDVWLRSEQTGKLIYGPTTEVWHAWLKADGHFGKLLHPMVDGQNPPPDRLRELAREWSSSSFVDKKLAETDRQLRKMGAKRKPIEARAKEAVRRKVSLALRHIDEWLKHFESEPGSLEGYVENQIEECRHAVENAGLLADPSIDLIRWSKETPFGEEALSVTQRLLKRLRDFIHGNNASADADNAVLDGPEILRNADLCYVAASDPMGGDPHRWLQLLCKTVCEPTDEDDLFSSHLDNGRLWAAESLQDRSRARGSRSLGEDDSRRRIQESRKQHRVNLQRKVEAAERDIVRAVRLDLLGDSEREQLTGEVTIVREGLDRVLDVPKAAARIDRVRSEIGEKEQIRVSELRQEAARLRESARGGLVGSSLHDDLDRINETLESGDYVAAAEYIDIVQRGESLSESGERHADSFEVFFPKFVEAFTDWCESGHGATIDMDFIKSVAVGRPIGPLRFDGVAKPRLQEAETLLNAWRIMKRGGNASSIGSELSRFLSAIGMRVSNVKDFNVQGRKANWVTKIECETIQDRSICIVPRFGSEAAGRYNVCGIHGRPSGTDLVARVEKVTARGPTLVLYFGRMSVRDRRELARHRPDADRPLIVLDEALVAFLAASREARLRAMFACTLPFACAQPYTDTASTVPPEMFFGREDEFNDVFRPDGTNLVFGGRQLGKSVLLREVANRRHDEQSGCIVAWLDLKNKGIGTTRAPGDLWQIIGEELHRLRVLEREASSASRIAGRVKEWLDDAAQRRVLLLLDEADAFFEQDSKSMSSTKGGAAFPVVSELKGLMDETNRRFKVVFAGLHNVQRAARDPNTPIAHLGTPVNIGPMYDSGQWREAKRLVEEPLSRLGYRFETPELSMRVLSHANFYPSLIQVFCKHLLNELQRSRGQVDYSVAPPYTITAAQVEKVYGDRGLQQEIRKRFELSLLLDNRYRVLALIVALESIELAEEGSGSDGVIDGFSVPWLRKQALGWWPEGFREDSSHEQLRILLDEMVGLGILRAIGPDSYRLRSNNILRFLGSRSEIEEKLQDAASEMPPAPYEASSFRRSLPESGEVLSPLTAAQEADLLDRSNGVCVVSGCCLSDLDRLVDGVRELATHDVAVCEISDATLLQSFAKALEAIDAEKKGDGLTLCLVRGAWRPEWVEHAVSLVRRKTSSKKSFLRVIFSANPSLLWEWGRQDPKTPGVVEIQLRPWCVATLRRWLTEQQYGADTVTPKGLQEIMSLTGGWPTLLYRFHDRCGRTTQPLLRLMEDARDACMMDSSSLEQESPSLPIAAIRDIANNWGMEFEPEMIGELVGELTGSLDGDRLTEWAEWLGWLRIGDEADLYRLDTAVAGVLKEQPV